MRCQRSKDETSMKTSEALIPILGTCLSKESVWKQEGKSLLSFRSEIYVEEI